MLTVIERVDLLDIHMEGGLFLGINRKLGE